MRFSCPACGKAYRLPPERLGPQGKAQIACPNCKALVAVAAGEGEDLQCTLLRAADRPPSGAVAPMGADAGATTATAGGWFVVIGKERQGPFSREQIAELGTAGKLTQASMAWQKGLAAWTKIADLPELAALVPAARASQLTVAAPEPAAKAEPKAEAAAAAAPALKAEPAKSEAAKPEPANTAPAKTEPAKTEPAKTEPTKTEPTKAPAAKAEPKAAASQAAAGAGEASKTAAKPGTPGGPVLDLFGDAKGGPGHHDSFFSSHQEIQLPDPHAHKPTKEEYQNLIQEFSVMFRLDKRSKRQKVLIGVVLGSLVVAAITFGVVLKIGADQKRQLLTDSKQMLAAFSLSFATTVNVDVANADGENTPADAKKPSVRKDVSAFSQEIAKKIRKKRNPGLAKAAGNGGSSGSAQPVRKEDAAKTAAADAAWIKKQQEEAMKALAGPGGKTENLGMGVPGASTFDFKAELKGVCRSREGDMRACGKNAGQESGFTVTLTFNELGGVGKATVSGADASIGPCIASKLRGVRIGSQASGKSGDCKVD